MKQERTNARALGLTLAILLLAPASQPFASAQQTAATDDWCREDNRGRVGFCEVRQFTIAATGGVLSVRGTNGGIRVDGEARGDVQIQAKVVATAATEARAREIVGSIRIASDLERVEADGPRGLQNREGWSVSYRLLVPRALNLALHTTNGGISIRDVESKIEFGTTNGGVKLMSVAGDVRGRTTNGGVDIELEGPSWIGEGLEVETTNGGVKIAVPEHYSANLEASTRNGGVSVGVPGVRQQVQNRNVSVQLGSGGAPIRVRTSNGGVRIVRTP
jgi:DUF4097 and DUF4098 domain-containing protein YvlB